LQLLCRGQTGALNQALTLRRGLPDCTTEHVYEDMSAVSDPKPKYYLPIYDPDVILEGCETLLRSLVQRVIEKYVNGGNTVTGMRYQVNNNN
jgi:hypothetical protein